MVVPPGPATHPSATAALPAWVVYGGRDRTIAEWEDLHHRSGLEIRAVTAISGPYSVIASVVPG